MPCSRRAARLFVCSWLPLAAEQSPLVRDPGWTPVRAKNRSRRTGVSACQCAHSASSGTNPKPTEGAWALCRTWLLLDVVPCHHIRVCGSCRICGRGKVPLSECASVRGTGERSRFVKVATHDSHAPELAVTRATASTMLSDTRHVSSIARS